MLQETMLFFFLFSILGVFGRVSLATPHLASGQGEQRSSRDPRFLDIFAGLDSFGGLNPLSALSQKNQAEDIRNQLAALEKGCAEFGGKVLNGECYQYFEKSLDIENAREFCQERGGDLWTPLMDDTFLFEKLIMIFPEFPESSDLVVLLGILPGEYINFLGNDVSETFLFKKCGSNFCARYDLEAFGPLCAACMGNFFCEYPITLQEVRRETIWDKVSNFFDFGIKDGK